MKIVITGGAGLLGVKHAEAIASAGGIPILADLNGELASKHAAYLSNNFKVSALGVKVDITRKAELEDLRDKIENKFGRIDGLINNAESATTSGKAPLLEAITCAPQAIASNAGKPKPSQRIFN